MTDVKIFGAITPSRAAEEVVRRIEVLVLEGVLRNGDRLPSERDLASEMDVSRPVLRDALKHLETRKILETRHGHGTVVADVVGSIFSKPVEDLMRDYPRTSVDYVEFRRELEGWAAALAAERATDDDRAILSAICERMEIAHREQDVKREGEIDLEFHLTIADCAHNIILIHSLRSCYRLLADNVLLNRSMIYDLPGAREKFLEQHRAIFDSIMARDKQAARAAAHAHMAYVESTMKVVDRLDLWQKNAELRRKRHERNT